MENETDMSSICVLIACIEVTTAVILTHTEFIKIKFTSLSLLAMIFAAIDHCHSYATVTKWRPFPIGNASQQRVLSLVWKINGRSNVSCHWFGK